MSGMNTHSRAAPLALATSAAPRTIAAPSRATTAPFRATTAVSRATIVALLVIIALAACAPPSQLVRVDGSAGVAPLVSALADAWRRAGARDSLHIATGLGSSARADALLEGRIHLAMASHGVDTAALARRGIVVHEMARTPVMFAVNAGVPVRAITGEQACGILAGRIVNWRELGGPDLPIVPAMRPPDEVDAEVMLAALPCLRATTLASAVRVVARPDSMAALLARTPGAFGLTSATFVNAGGGRIHALALDGVAATAANVSAGRTPARSSYLLTTQAPLSAVRRFLAWVRSAEGRRVIEQSGGVPVP